MSEVNYQLSNIFLHGVAPDKGKLLIEQYTATNETKNYLMDRKSKKGPGHFRCMTFAHFPSYCSCWLRASVPSGNRCHANIRILACPGDRLRRKNSADVKNALLDYQIQIQANRATTAGPSADHG